MYEKLFFYHLFETTCGCDRSENFSYLSPTIKIMRAQAVWCCCVCYGPGQDTLVLGLSSNHITPNVCLLSADQTLQAALLVLAMSSGCPYHASFIDEERERS